MDYQIIEHRHAQGVFSVPFSGDGKGVVAIRFRDKLYSPEGKKLAEGTPLADFCKGLGVAAKPSKPKRPHQDFIGTFLDLHFPRTAKGGKKGKTAPKGKAGTKAPKPVKAEPTPEQKRERATLEQLGTEFETRTLGGNSRERGGRKQRGGKTIVYGIKDRNDKLAEATYTGKWGEFVSCNPREGAGTKTLARNRWAAKQLSERFRAIEGEMHAAELRAAEADNG